jgi:hypothetical protein
MHYIRVRWLHQDVDSPVWLISELDDDRWEVRKVEIYRDGSKGYATRNSEHNNARLGLVPVPPLDVIAADPEFLPEEITGDEFEAIWSARISSNPPELTR